MVVVATVGPVQLQLRFIIMKRTKSQLPAAASTVVVGIDAILFNHSSFSLLYSCSITKEREIPVLMWMDRTPD